MFDTLTDLVEHYKRKGIEEMSGNWVQFKQVSRESQKKCFFFSFDFVLKIKILSCKKRLIWQLGKHLATETSLSG